MTRTLRIQPNSACLQRDTDTFGRMDPYIILTLGTNVVQKTKTCIEGGKNPRWGDLIEFTVYNEDALKFEVWAKATVGKDNLVGEAIFALSELQSVKSVYTVQLHYHGKFSGTLKLEMEIYPKIGAAQSPVSAGILGGVSPVIVPSQPAGGLYPTLGPQSTQPQGLMAHIWAPNNGGDRGLSVPVPSAPFGLDPSQPFTIPQYAPAAKKPSEPILYPSFGQNEGNMIPQGQVMHGHQPPPPMVLPAPKQATNGGLTVIPAWKPTEEIPKRTLKRIAKDVYRQFDSKRTDRLGFDQFYPAFSQVCQVLNTIPPTNEDIQYIFLIVDSKSRGYITRKEFKKVCKHLFGYPSKKFGRQL